MRVQYSFDYDGELGRLYLYPLGGRGNPLHDGNFGFYKDGTRVNAEAFLRDLVREKYPEVEIVEGNE